jgi:hypothetical protein
MQRTISGGISSTPIQASSDAANLRERVSQLKTQSDTKRRSSLETEWEHISEQLNDNAARERAGIVQQIKSNMDSPHGWLALLHFDLEQWRRDQRADRMQALLRLYDRATRSINKQQYRKTDEYLQIWIGYAKAQA